MKILVLAVVAIALETAAAAASAAVRLAVAIVAVTVMPLPDDACSRRRLATIERVMSSAVTPLPAAAARFAR